MAAPAFQKPFLAIRIYYTVFMNYCNGEKIKIRLHFAYLKIIFCEQTEFLSY